MEIITLIKRNDTLLYRIIILAYTFFLAIVAVTIPIIMILLILEFREKDSHSLIIVVSNFQDFFSESF